MLASGLPARVRPDPRMPSGSLTQRHRWRVGPAQSIVVDSSARQLHPTSIRRAISTLLPPNRMAALLSTPLGNSFGRALKEGDWPLVQALLREARLRVGTPQQVLTQAELDEIGRIGDDYEADLR